MIYPFLAETKVNGIADEWENISKSTILKCKIDIESWYPPQDVYEQANRIKKSYEIAKKGFLYLADTYFVKLYGKQHGHKIRSDEYYPFVKHGMGIPPTKIIKLIEPI